MAYYFLVLLMAVSANITGLLRVRGGSQIMSAAELHLYILIILFKDCVFFLLNMIIHEHNVLEYTNKNYDSKGGGVSKC